MEEIGIESSLVNAIGLGEKTIEMRLGKPRFLKFQEGDVVSIREDIWQNDTVIEEHPGVLKIVITEILYFETFKEALEAVDFQSVAPFAETLGDALDGLKKFYSSADEQKYGVVAMLFELADDES